MSDLNEQGARLYDEGKITEAVACYQQQLVLTPGSVSTLNKLANALAAVGRSQEAKHIFELLLSQVRPPLSYRVVSNYLSWLQYQLDCSPLDLKRITAELAAHFGIEEKLLPRPPNTPLRIGFISGDLCDHPVGFFLLPLLTHLDRRRFKPILYLTGGRSDATSYALGRLAERHSVDNFDIDALVGMLRSQQLDVLIDLSGHTAKHRLSAFARRVAPIQISWLGYSATTGVAAMDYVLLDPWHAPLGTDDYFTERVIRLHHTRFCYRPVRFAPEITPPPCLANGFVTFGSFNNTAKYHDELFKVWAAILRRVENSRLVLKWRTFADPPYCEHVWETFEALGIGRNRIDLRQASVHQELLQEYADIDIALDPFPFSGGHTSCEALWMGLPVVTLPSERPVSRQTLCFIGNLERADWQRDWVATSAADYVEKAIALACDANQLQAIRQTLRPAMRRSPLMDEAAFTRAFESAIEKLIGLEL